MRRSCEVTFLPDRVTVTAFAGDTILDAALDHGVLIEHECGGNCSCTTCHVLIREGPENLSPPDEPERYRIEFATGRALNSRLACQALLTGGSVMVEIRQAMTDDEERTDRVII